MSRSHDANYPHNPKEWQKWLDHNLGISCNQCRVLIKEDKFPYNLLTKKWEEKFSSELGYSPSFIPALIRNKNSFVKWVYLDSPEPNWTQSDIERQWTYYLSQILNFF